METVELAVARSCTKSASSSLSSSESPSDERGVGRVDRSLTKAPRSFYNHIERLGETLQCDSYLRGMSNHGRRSRHSQKHQLHHDGGYYGNEDEILGLNSQVATKGKMKGRVMELSGKQDEIDGMNYGPMHLMFHSVMIELENVLNTCETLPHLSITPLA